MIKDIKIWNNHESLNLVLKKQLSELNNDELNDAFNKNISFGTGGIRGLMGVGTNRINYHTIVKATLGLAQKLINEYKKTKDQIIVVVCYDTRFDSLLFAETTAITLGYCGIKVKLFAQPRPTPQLSYAVRYFKAQAGVMITASHNPPQYNGYKIYDLTGCQYVPKDADKLSILIDSIDNYLDIELPSLDFLISKNVVEYIALSFDDVYLSMIKAICFQDVDCGNLKVVYSPLHGVGNAIGPRLLLDRNVNFIPVSSQMSQDPYFGKLSSPNPEDAETYNEAFKVAKQYDADIVMVTDPDGDRLGVAINVEGVYHRLSGNQIAAIIIDYLVRFIDIKDGILLTTVVSSNLGSSIAKENGLSVIKTLTGFKFIGEQIELLNQRNKKFIFAYEESFGFLIDDNVRDKDAFQAMWLLCEIASFYKAKNMGLNDVLSSIYARYGYYYDQLLNFTLPSNATTINQVMDYLRNNNYTHWGSQKIKRTCDYSFMNKQKSYDEAESLPLSNLIKYEFDNGGYIAFRPSGTEPKFKLYVSLIADNEKQAICHSTAIISDIKNILKQFNLK